MKRQKTIIRQDNTRVDKTRQHKNRQKTKDKRQHKAALQRIG